MKSTCPAHKTVAGKGPAVRGVRHRRNHERRSQVVPGARFAVAELIDSVLYINGVSGTVFNVVASHLGDDAGRFVAEVESVEL